MPDSVFPAPDAELVLPPGCDRTPEWYAARRSGIGGSEIAACVDQHPHTTAVEVWRDKLGATASKPPTDAMLQGIYAEPYIADVFAASVGVEVTKTGMWRHRDHPIALANPDRLVSDGTGLEIKSHGPHSCDLWEQIDPPFHAEAQAQWCMYVTGIRTWWVAAWCKAASELRTWRRAYDPDLVEYLRYGADAVWHCVETRTMPAGSTVADIDALYPAPAPGAEVIDDRLGALRARYDELTADRDALKAQLDAVAQRLDEVRSDVKQILGTAETGKDAGGRTVVTWRASSRNDIDVKALRRCDPDVAARHARITNIRRLNFPEIS